MSLEISDGVSSASLLVIREIMAEIKLAKMKITENSVLVIRGRISRLPNDIGHTALVVNECPRLVLSGGT